MSNSQTTSQAWIVWVTAPSDNAATLARGIVEQNLAACVQQLPIQSTYRWQNQICTDNEVLLLCKTTQPCYVALEQYILNHHPYTTPQILATPASAGLPAYVEWLQQNTLKP